MARCYVTLGLFRRDFGEEGHLRHGHKREPQQLEKDPDDEGRQLPPVAAWRKDGGTIHRILIALTKHFNTAAPISASGSERATDQSARPLFCQVLGSLPQMGWHRRRRLYLEPGATAKLAAAAFFVLRGVFVSQRTRPDCWMFLRRAVIS